MTGAVQTVMARIAGAHPVQLSLPDTAMPVDGDALRLEIAVANLVDNAIRYSPEGAAVEVRCSVAEDGGQAVVEVEDRGLGIASEHRPHLFRIFGRIVTPDNSHIPGTGLRLYLASRIAELHGGGITVESEVDSGSTFRLVLPLVDVCAATEQLTG